MDKTPKRESKAMRRAKFLLRLPKEYSRHIGWSYSEELIDVSVLATANGYAMVRRKRGVPFVVPEKELQ